MRVGEGSVCWPPAGSCGCSTSPNGGVSPTGALPDHPEVGEEAFVVERDADDAVWLGITAFSRPNGFLPGLAGPVGRRAQTMLTTRYARVVRDAVGHREV
ncbi:DUF1990 family protein [Parafrankia sp. FMc2]